MKFFPMFLRMEGRRVVIVGGGETAAQKSRLILKSTAEIVILANDLEDEVKALVTEGRAQHDAGPITPQSFAGAALTFIGTGCPGADMAIHTLAREAGALVNVVDQPELCEATTPSIVDRDPLVIAIGTEGAAPVLARQIKTRMEEILEPRLGELVALGGRLRGAVAQKVPREARRALWRWVYDGAPRQLHARGAEREAAERLKAAIEAGGAPDDAGGGALALIGAGPGLRDLMTLRAVQRLQEADVVFLAPGLPAELLELARRDAERVQIGAAPGTQTWDIPAAAAHIAAAAEGGKIVWLIPGAAAQNCPEARALAAQNAEFETVPGLPGGAGES